MSPTTEFAPGVPRRIAPGVWRLVAPNASAMTGPGTNTYLLGDPPVAVLDPGPDEPSHLAAILAAVPRPQQVFVTHTHRDHSPLAAALAARTGARLVGRPPPGDGRQDLSFAPQQVPVRDECFEVGGRRLRAIDTPGHASNHVCWLLEDERLLFTGDHLLDGVTPVILAPDGDMTDYLDALHRLRGYALARLAPGHGRVLESPYELIDQVVAHRLRREAMVAGALAAAGEAGLDELLPVVYRGIGPELQRFARLSLLAHLIKLARDGRARAEGERWHAA
ncbi:MAG: MBL fold metallo-hydrolase [Steroidobacteraceae bacterium]|jgi:glyoxylase-like metal-dependent hydrolase (beta-lactamase superfamily II)|nr:MBL fold metallo-hydrolase [Steroidobacteraceae bacterium]